MSKIIDELIREAETSNDMWKLTPEELLRKYLEKLEYRLGEIGRKNPYTLYRIVVKKEALKP